MNSDPITVSRKSADTFSVFLPTEGVATFSIDELKYSVEVNLISTSLEGQTPDEVYEAITATFPVESLGSTEDQELVTNQIASAKATFESYSAEEKQIVAKFIKANEAEIQALISGQLPESNGRIVSDYCPDKVGLDRLECLIRPFARNLLIVGTSSVLVVASSTTGVGAIIGGVIGGFVTLPALIRVRDIGYDMVNTGAILLDDQFIFNNTRVSAVNEYEVSGKTATLDFSYELRTLNASDVSAEDSLIQAAVTAIIDFEELWNTYIGDELALDFGFNENSVLVRPSTSNLSVEVEEGSALTIAGKEVIDEIVQLTLGNLQANSEAATLEVTLSDSLVSRSYTLTIAATDCNGDAGGQAYLDDCEECVGGATGKNACFIDCAGVVGGSAYIDGCETCVGGTTGLEECPIDCNGVPGGDA